MFWPRSKAGAPMNLISRKFNPPPLASLLQICPWTDVFWPQLGEIHLYDILINRPDRQFRFIVPNFELLLEFTIFARTSGPIQLLILLPPPLKKKPDLTIIYDFFVLFYIFRDDIRKIKMLKNHLDMIGRNEPVQRKAKFWQSYVRALKGKQKQKIRLQNIIYNRRFADLREINEQI